MGGALAPPTTIATGLLVQLTLGAFFRIAIQASKEEPKKDRDEIERQGEKYGKTDSYEKLTGLAEKLRDSDERLPFEQYQKLRGWIENRDRERFSGALEQQVEHADKQERTRTHADLKALEGGRVLEPLQEELMKNPIVGLFMTEASIASEIVRSIPLDDRNHDYLKDLRDELVDIKNDIEEASRHRMPWESGRDKPTLEKIEKAIEEVEQKREEQRKREKEQRERDRDDWDRFDPWGRH